MTIAQLVTHENHPPRIWGIPTEIRRRLSGRVGRQRVLASEGHLVMVLHPVPNRNCPRQPGVYFWRSPDGDWAHSEQGPGFASLESLVQEYENKVVELEHANEVATSTRAWFAILDELGPLCRAARNLRDTLTDALEESSCYDQRAQLQPLCDQTSEVERSAELLQMDVQHAIQYSMAQQTEIQAGFSRAQSRAAHRLNILAAIFLPLATLSSAFGMNLASGLESTTPLIFWTVLLLGAGLGVGIGVGVMKVRTISPDDW